MTEDQQERLRTVEVAVSDIRVRQTQLESLLEQNTRTTEQIKRDTSEIVELVKGAGIIGRLVKWFTVVVGGYLAGKGLKWW